MLQVQREQQCERKKEKQTLMSDREILKHSQTHNILTEQCTTDPLYTIESAAKTSLLARVRAGSLEQNQCRTSFAEHCSKKLLCARDEEQERIEQTPTKQTNHKHTAQ